MRGAKRSIASIVLGFEFVVIFLAALVLDGLHAFGVLGLPDFAALIAGGVLLLLTVLALATLRWNIGYAFGWLVQLLMLASGVLQPLMFVVGAMFTAIWWYGLRVGGRLDRESEQPISVEEAGTHDI